ncbi:hypothetical protein RKE38_10460 [Phycicoccus sp. M110.8]|uniref:hypothetical protein n=1 Tax=Phycicoccus sp. M110.8 TaxID=3075433 RepID=UPI0028FD27E1|nr:hypothetical protein [Phycicoccus sp. M110.8]MDU0314107.1 hypothetical protein [Phycicoccus sp. M110.8]
MRIRPAKDFDREDVGELTVPAPDLDDLAADLAAGFAFLGDLDPHERKAAAIDGADRALVLRMLAELPGERLPFGSCW